MTTAAEHPATAATIDGRPVAVVLADTAERIVVAVFGGWPPPRPAPGTDPAPHPAVEET